MDKNRIKSFAIWARRSLIKSVSEKAYSIGIYEDKILEATTVQGGFKLDGKEEIFTLSKKNRDALVKQVNEKGFEQVMEEVAYTWFNRFMGLRYMEVNDYLPTGVRILSSEIEGKKEPDVLTKVSEIIDELNLNANEIYDLLDTGNTLDREKAYRIILVKQCNELGKIIPQMFEKISDYTELLLPDNLLEEGSVIRKMVEDIEESDWREEVEIIGWMYQYYISEKKDEVFAALKKNVKITKENIPAATQLFTPKWIVKYMVENSLGRLWLEGHPNEELQREFKYYLEEAEQEQEVEEELKKIREEHAKLKPEDIKVLDPCMGSGHILVYAFDVLYEIYKTAGYSEREIPRLILQNNLYGLDIDDRAAQLASFALIMKARHYNRRLFREIEREHLELNLCAIQESNSISKEAIDYFCTLGKGNDDEIRSAIEYLCEVFEDAKEYGSILEVEKVNFDTLKQRIKEIEDDDNLIFGDYRKILLEKIPVIIKQGEIMSKAYEIVITNPPYVGSAGMNNKLTIYLKKNYPRSKSDLFGVFIEKCLKYSKTYCYSSLITMQVWMFIASFEELRGKIINDYQINNLLQIGFNSFPELNSKFAQAVSFTLQKVKVYNYNSVCFDLNDIEQNSDKNEVFLNKKKNNSFYSLDMEKMNSIPGKPIAYWCSDDVINLFKNEKKLGEYAEPRQGLATGENDRFLRRWFEVNYIKIGLSYDSISHAHLSDKKWFPYNKGGDYRKWYGNQEFVIAFDKENYDILSQQGNHLPSKQFYFKEGLTWSFISSKGFGVRYSPKGFVFDVGGSSAFPEKEALNAIIGYLCSNIAYELLRVQNPTMNFQVGNIRALPFVNPNKKILEDINIRVNENIRISKKDWDSKETSWGFLKNPLINTNCTKMIDALSKHNEVMQSNIKLLTENEVYLNNIYANLFNLDEYKICTIDKKFISLRKEDLDTDVREFIMYSIGCMFGRYSIDSEGLIYAGGNFGDKWNWGEGKVRKIEKDADGNIISDSWVDSRFMPDRDNIIPITEDEYFEDDIVTRFIEFVRTVYGEETLEENLDFIADSIGRKSSETSRQAIRRYFIKDFYKDHLKVYQKRPIYWMFESGKNDGFKCLIYMHRYNEQTVAKVRTDYLHTLQRKYEAEIKRLQLVVDSEEYTAKDRTTAKKKIDRISKQIEECREYDQVVAYLANEKISIDLDDGVKVNYAKFQNIKVINSKGKETKMNLLVKI
ncbi:BREX-1 system adenine-specific DNA-methyltransferase PglX [Clostridium tertium]